MEFNMRNKLNILGCAISCLVLAPVSHLALAEEIEKPSQIPLFLQEGVAPNVLLTIDNSGSMAMAYLPDELEWAKKTRAGRSSRFNVQYYDPEITYEIPQRLVSKPMLDNTGKPIVDGNGQAISQLVVEDYPIPAFNNAPSNGFLPSDYWSHYYNLSDNYIAQWGSPLMMDGWMPCIDNCREGTDPSLNNSKVMVSRAYYYLYSPSCDQKNISSDDSCYTHQFVKPEEEQNFAIWFSYYRNRMNTTQSVMSRVLLNLPAKIRFTWGDFTTCMIGSDSKQCKYNKIKDFEGQHVVNFYEWLNNLKANGATPSHAATMRAGNLIQDPSNYSKDASGKPYACQGNFHIFMTDGVWNEKPADNRLPNDGRTSQKDIKLPDAQLYRANSDLSRPYRERYTGSLADLAFHYWATPALGEQAKYEGSKRIDFPNTDPQAEYWDPRNNPATWPHMVNYTMGLGLSQYLNRSDAPTWNDQLDNPTYAYVDELKQLGNNGKQWPMLGDDSPANVYDIWHMAVNSRGEYFNIDRPDSFIRAMNRIFTLISAASSTAAPPAMSSGTDDDGSGYSYQAYFYPDAGWAGDLQAVRHSLGSDSKAVQSTQWSARALLDQQNYQKRLAHLFIGTDKGLKAARWENLTDRQRAYLGRNSELANKPDDLGLERFNFILGDRSNEQTLFRERSHVLGDIINSQPAVVRGARYTAQRGNLLEPHAASNYAAFVQQMAKRKAMVYVGANDGMLHAFDAQTGEETFAYLPSMIITELNQLASKNYTHNTHRYFVDGSPQVADVYIKNQWRTVLVGSLGAGGKGLFALDITNPEQIQLLWEIDENSLAQQEVGLGYSLSVPTIARLHNGRWAAVVGNGYAADSSLSGKASLLVIDMETGALTANLTVEGSKGVANGLSTPRLVDMNGNGLADFAYAGDLQGNLWRFDLNSTATNFNRQTPEKATFAVAFGGKPLFKAVDAQGKAQPISVAPSIIRHPSRHGLMVLLGTGKYYTERDKFGLDNKQALYGIWDPSSYKPHAANRQDFPSNNLYSRNDLQQQKIEKQNAGGMVVSQQALNWRIRGNDGTWSQSGKMGWYMDLSQEKEMVISEGSIFGTTYIVQSMQPVPDPCHSGITNWLYALNSTTGGRTKNVFWHDHPKSPDGEYVSVISSTGTGGFTIGQKPNGNYQLCTGESCETIIPDRSTLGRQNWRLVHE